MEKYHNRSFTDFEGNKRIVTVCILHTEGTNAYKLGWACQHPKDAQDNPEISKTIAKNRAASSKIIGKIKGNLIYVEHSGFIQANIDKFASLMLVMYADYLCENPGIMIKGYKYSKKKAIERMTVKKDLDTMSTADKLKMTILATASESDIDKAKNLYKYYKG